MIFLYSRKSQLALLLCWFVGMTVLYVQITGNSPHWLRSASEQIVDTSQKARIGQLPALSDPVAQPVTPPPAPAPVATPAAPPADPNLNRCLALRVEQKSGARPDDLVDTLILEVDYLAATNKGFTPQKAHGYYLDGSPTFVLALGEPWTSDIGTPSFQGSLSQLVKVEMIVSKSKNLRLLVHTRAMPVARGARYQVVPTATGIRAEVRLPRQGN